MSAGRIVAVILVAFWVALPGLGQAPSSAQPDLKSLFPKRAEFFADQPGLTRLLLPPEVLAQCQPDLSDLRVVDGRGREVPYIVDSGPPPDRVLEQRVVYEPQILSAARQTEERDSAPDIQRETYHLSLPEGEPQRWDLVIESSSTRFVRQFVVMAMNEGEQGRRIEEGSLFRLRGPRREKLRATLPSFDADYLAVTLEGEGEGFLEPSFRFESSRVLPEHEQLRVDLVVRRIHSAAGRTVVELERPRGLVPDQLLVSTTTASLNRRFEVWDEGSGSVDTPLGAGTLYRLAGAGNVERMDLPLEQAHGDGLRVTIADGDSPPLENVAFQAALRRPSLVFSLDVAEPGEASGSLLYGGARAFRPRYDLAGLLAEQRRLTGEEARIGIELRDSSRLGLARLGPTGPNQLWDPAPALAFAMRPGTKIATDSFGYRRAIPVPDTSEGLLRLRLGPETVARCRQDLADVRLVDAESRQWPYLLDSSASTVRLPLALRGPETDEAMSTYFLALPASPLELERLILDGPAPYFDRPFELFAKLPGRGDRPRRLAGGRLTRRPEDPREISVAIGGGPVDALELRVQDGDDSALDWTTAEARIALPELFFAAPRGDYTLLFGDPEARRPRYELERVRDLVLAVDSTIVAPGELIESPGRGAFSRFRGDGGWQQVLLWSALTLAALALAWITLRLARQEPSP